jgi:hypothetical protein
MRFVTGVMVLRTIVLLPLVLCAACATTQTVSRIDRSKHPILRVCIQENWSVTVPDVPDVFVRGLKQRGIEATLFRGVQPEGCEYVLSYVGSLGTDIKPYLRSMIVTISRNGAVVGRASHATAEFALSKWGTVESKVNPLLDELLADFK